MSNFPVQITIGAALSGTLGAAVRGAQSQLNQLGSTISDLSNQQAGVGRLTNLRGQAAQSAQAMRAAQARVRAAQAAVNAAGPGNATATQTRELQRALAAAARAEQAYRRQRTAVDELTQSLRRAGVDTRNLGNEQNRLGQQLDLVRRRTDALARATQAQQRNMENRGAYRTQMMDAAALGLALAAPIKKAAEFEQAMANVGAVARASDEDVGRLTKQARELGASTNWTASQAAEGMKYLAMAGFNTEQTMAAMPGMLNLASAGAIDLGSAADIASNILTGFNLEAGQMGRVGDILTATFTSSNTTLQSLGYTMKYVAPIAASTGTAIETVAAMAGKLGDAGIQGEMAGTALRAMLTRLAAPTDKAGGLLKQLGVATTDANGNLRPMVEVLKELDASMVDLGSAEKSAAVATLFGVEAASAATVLMAQAASGAIDAMAAAITREGTAAEVAAKQNATTIGALKRLGSAMESMAISIGSVLLPPLAQLADRLAPIITGMSAWAEAHPQLTTALVGTLAGAMALKIGVIGLGYAFTFIKGPILAANTAIAMIRAQMALISVGAASSAGPLTLLGAAFTRATTAVRAFALALVANPVGLTIAAIGAAVVGLAVVIRKYWEPLSAFVTGVFQGIASAIQPAMAGISAAFAPVKAAFEPLAPLFSAIGSALSSVVDWFSSLLTPVQLTSAEFDGFVAKGQAVGAVLGGAINTGLQLVMPALQTLGQLLGLAVQGWTLLGQMAVQAWNHITAVFQNNAPLAALQQLGSQLVGALASLPGQFMAIGGQIIQGLISGIKAKIGAAVAAAGEAVSGVINGAKAKLGIKSPSRVFAEMGENINAGMAQGLIRSGTIAIQPVEQLAARMGAVPFGLQPAQPPAPDSGASDWGFQYKGAFPTSTPPFAEPPAPQEPNRGEPDWGFSYKGAFPTSRELFGEPPAPPAWPAIGAPPVWPKPPAWGEPPPPPAFPSWGEPPAPPVWPVIGAPPPPAWPPFDAPPTTMAQSPEDAPEQPPAQPLRLGLAPVFARVAQTLSQAADQIKLPALSFAPVLPPPLPAGPGAALPGPTRMPTPAFGAPIPAPAPAVQPSVTSPASPPAVPPAMPAAQPLASAPAMPAAAPGAQGGIHFAPTITINAGAGQDDPDALAQLIEHRLRGMFRDTLRGTAASMFD